MENVEPSRARGLDSDGPKSTRRLLLIVSLVLNIGLLLCLAFINGKSNPEVETKNRSFDHTGGTSERAVKSFPNRARTPSAWSQLESTNLATYAANLRAAGCPPKTVRDILLPMIEEQFELPGNSSEPIPFWASFSQRQAAAVAKMEQKIAREKERDLFLEEVLGFAWASGGLNQAHAFEAAFSAGFMEYERAEKFFCVAERFKESFSRAGLHRIDRRSAVYQAWSEEVNEVLSPTELEEAELRGLLLIFQRRNPQFFNAGLSGSELRQLMAFRRELCKPFPSALLSGSDEIVQEPDWATEQKFLAKVRSLLGDNRFIEYLKGCDVIMEKTLVALENGRLPQSLALELFDFREEALTQAREIRQMELRRSEKRAHLAALRQSALEQLAALSNSASHDPWLNIIRDWLPEDTKNVPSADSALLEINRDWLQEIANP